MPSIIGFLFLTLGRRIYKTTFFRLGWKKVLATHTKQFVIENISLFRNDMVIPRSYPLNVLMTADLAAMKISNK